VEVNELSAKAKKLEKEQACDNQSSVVNATKMPATRKTCSEAINATDSTGFVVLKLSERYGSAVAVIVISVKKEYHDLHAVIDEKEGELDHTEVMTNLLHHFLRHSIFSPKLLLLSRITKTLLLVPQVSVSTSQCS